MSKFVECDVPHPTMKMLLRGESSNIRAAVWDRGRRFVSCIHSCNFVSDTDQEIHVSIRVREIGGSYTNPTHIEIEEAKKHFGLEDGEVETIKGRLYVVKKVEK